MGTDRTLTKFNRGEVDENFLARDDVERIVDTSAQMENMLPIRLGPMQYRPGMEHLGTAQTAASTLTVPFLVSGNKSVELEFFQTSANPSVEGFRVWNDGVLLVRTGTANTIANGTFDTDLTDWTDGDSGSGVSAWATGGYMSLKGDGAGGYGRRSQDLTVTAAAKRTIRITIARGPVEVLLGTAGADSGNIFSGVLKTGIHSLTFTPAATPVTITLRTDKAYASLVDGVEYEAAGTFVLSGSFMRDTSTTGAVLPTLQFAQSADVMFLWTNGFVLEGQAYPMLMVERRGDESWSLTIPDFEDGPFDTINDTQLTLAPSATSGDITLVASLPLFMDSTWVGRSYKILHAAVEGVCIVTGVTDSTNASARVTVPFGATTASANWYPGRFSQYQPGPTAGAIYDGRLWLGGAGSIDGSVSDAYTSFDGSLEGNAKAISKTIGFGPVQVVQWMWAGKTLLFGTEVMVGRLASNEFGDAITADNCRIIRASSDGCAATAPQSIGEVLYLVQRAGTRILELTNHSKEEGADSRDMMLLHPQIAAAGIVRMGLTQHPEPRLYVVLADGTMVVCLSEKAENVIGWTPVSMAEADILDVSVIPDNAEDEVYVVVQRNTTKYIERLAQFQDAVGGTISRHYDSHVYEATPGTTISGLTHLNGLEVYTWADGREFGPFTVASGAIAVPANSWANSITGVKHIGQYTTNRLGQYIPKSVISDRKRVTHLGLVLRDAVLGTIQFGPDADTLYPIPQVDIDQYAAPNTEPQVTGSLSESGAGAFSNVQALVRGNGYVYLLVGGEGDFAGGAPGQLLRVNAATWDLLAEEYLSEDQILSVVSIGGYLYAATGEKGNLLRLVAAADPPTRLAQWNGTTAWVELAPEINGQNKIYALTDMSSVLYGASGTSGLLLAYDGGTMSWSQKASQYGSVTRVNALAVLSAEVYGAANDGSLLKWNGVDAWEEAAPPLGSYVNAKELVELSGVLYAILCEAGQTMGKLHHFDGSDWVDTGPDTPTETVSFLSVSSARLFALKGDAVTNFTVYEYVGTSTYTQRTATTAVTSPTSFLVAGGWIVVGFSAGVIRALNNLSGSSGTAISAATGLSGAGAIMSLAESGGAFYAGDDAGQLFRDSSGASGVWNAVTTPALDAPASITALRFFGGNLYAGVSDGS